MIEMVTRGELWGKLTGNGCMCLECVGIAEKVGCVWKGVVENMKE